MILVVIINPVKVPPEPGLPSEETANLKIKKQSK